MANYEDPKTYEALSDELKKAVQEWIYLVLQPAKTVNRMTSYQLKHCFQYSTPNVYGKTYMTNGEFKGAMLAAGYEPINKDHKNWEFRVKTTSRYTRWSSKHVVGYGYSQDNYCICHCTQEQKEHFEATIARLKSTISRLNSQEKAG